MPRKERLPKNVSAFIDRHGKRRYRFRKTGYATHYFLAAPGTKAFEDELAAAREGVKPAGDGTYPRGTVGWIAARYRTSLAFTGQKNKQSEHNAWSILEKWVAEFTAYRLADFRFDHIEETLARASVKRKNDKGRTIGGPNAANNLRGELKPFFDYGFKLLGIEKPNPVTQAAPLKAPKGGFHTWTEDEIAQYRAHHAVGTTPRLALEIFLWTAQRRGDASTFGPRHIANGQATVVPSKTQNSTGQVVTLPVAPQLAEAIAAMKVTGTETFLVSAYGKPYSKAGLGMRMREWCDAAGLPQCSAHGLRKATARRAAEAGGSNQELKAVGGWTTDAQVAVYTAAASRVRLAEQAMGPVIAADLANGEK